RAVSLHPIREILRIGNIGLTRARVKLPNHHEAVGVAEGQRLQEYCVDYTKDGCIGSDAQHESKQRYRSECRCVPKDPRPKSNVLPKRLHVETAGCATGIPAVTC